MCSSRSGLVLSVILELEGVGSGRGPFHYNVPRRFAAPGLPFFGPGKASAVLFAQAVSRFSFGGGETNGSAVRDNKSAPRQRSRKQIPAAQLVRRPSIYASRVGGSGVKASCFNIFESVSSSLASIMMLSASAVLAAFWSNVRPPGLLFAVEYLGSSTNVRHAMVRDFTTVIFPEAWSSSQLLGPRASQLFRTRLGFEA